MLSNLFWTCVFMMFAPWSSMNHMPIKSRGPTKKSSHITPEYVMGEMSLWRKAFWRVLSMLLWLKFGVHYFIDFVTLERGKKKWNIIFAWQVPILAHATEPILVVWLVSLPQTLSFKVNMPNLDTNFIGHLYSEWCVQLETNTKIAMSPVKGNWTCV